EKPAEAVPAVRAADKPAGQAADPASSSADKPSAGTDPASRAAARTRDAAAPDSETPPGGASLAAAQARVADADH
ncbi:ribonuclease III, partial [Burkholderia sp. Ap-955]|nr:ribonuclease III [Burkholderia sp. Ap-955]